MYTTDKLMSVVKVPIGTDPDDVEWPDRAVVCDSSDDYKYVSWPCAYLDHSCDSWVIGGPTEVQQLIKDLTDILASWKE